MNFNTSGNDCPKSYNVKVDWKKRFADIAELSAWLRASLVEMGFTLIGQNTQTAPAVITIALPSEMDSLKIGAAIMTSDAHFSKVDGLQVITPPAEWFA